MFARSPEPSHPYVHSHSVFKNATELFRRAYQKNPKPPDERLGGSSHQKPTREETIRMMGMTTDHDEYRRKPERAGPSRSRRQPLVEEETDGECILYPRSQNNGQLPRRHTKRSLAQELPSVESVVTPPTIAPAPRLAEKGDRNGFRMNRRIFAEASFSDPESYAVGTGENARVNEIMKNVEASGHRASRSRLPDLTGLVTTANKYPFANGGLCDVWRGFWRTESGVHEVAVKVFRVQIESQQVKKKMDKRLRRELCIWQGLQHANIIPLYGISNSFGPSTSIVCPWMINGTLTDYLGGRGRSLSLPERFKLIYEVASGLCYLHSSNVVHGDLTGSNVLISSRGIAQLTDIGLSAVITEFHEMTHFTSTIRPGVRYTAPEIYEPQENSPTIRTTTHSDMYSFGSIMLQILSGKVPYYYLRSEPMVLLELYKGVRPQRPTEKWFTDHYWDFIDRCWNGGPSHRPTAQDAVSFVWRCYRNPQR